MGCKWEKEGLQVGTRWFSSGKVHLSGNMKGDETGLNKERIFVSSNVSTRDGRHADVTGLFSSVVRESN